MDRAEVRELLVAYGFEWPRFEDEPMAFFAELSLAEVHAALPVRPLPAGRPALFPRARGRARESRAVLQPT